MPTYQYHCTSCDADFERVQKFTDPAIESCPDCSGAVRKVFNAVGIVFKGSGFYATDSRSSGASSAALPAKTESTSDAAPAATPASAPAASAVCTAAAPAPATSTS